MSSRPLISSVIVGFALERVVPSTFKAALVSVCWRNEYRSSRGSCSQLGSFSRSAVRTYLSRMRYGCCDSNADLILGGRNLVDISFVIISLVVIGL